MLRQKMIHRSFKPSKCKTSLKLATSRLKLLKNKKEVQLKQMRRDLAQLLESGQNQTARIQVEHVIREEKMMAAYDLIEIYCELISIRLPVIESQKNCPIDLKEAVTSVIFASPRCADVPELLDIRKHLAAKYGKEFTTAAFELRPECGVSRMLIEKLSAAASDSKAKIKVLSSIAEEHNIKWDPESFAEKELKPSNDLLNGPATFERASVMLGESIQFQAQNVQALIDDYQKHDGSSRSSLGSENLAYSSGIRISPTTSPAIRPNASQTHPSQSYSADANEFMVGKYTNMEFKDATTAAQAAAESAERASVAARAAAELSRQHLKSRNSNIHGSLYENSTNYATSKCPTQAFPKESECDASPDRIADLRCEQREVKGTANQGFAAEAFLQDFNSGTRASFNAAPPRSSNVSTNYDASVDNTQTADEYAKQGQYKEQAIRKAPKGSSSNETSMREHLTESEAEPRSELRDNFIPHSGDHWLGTQSDIHLQSESNLYRDEQKVLQFNYQNVGTDADENPFFKKAAEPIHTSTHDEKAVVFDESGSDEDDYMLSYSQKDDYILTGPKYDGSGYNSFIMSEGRKSPHHLPTNIRASSPRNNMSKQPLLSPVVPSTDFSREFGNPLDYSEQSSFVPVTYDDSDDAQTEEEVEVDNFKHNRVQRSARENVSPSDHSVWMNKEPKEQRDELFDTSRGYKPQDDSNSESEKKGLNFPKLKGGLRNKGTSQPPFLKSTSNDVLPSSQEDVGVVSTKVEQPLYTSTSRVPFNSEVNTNVDDKVSLKMPLSDPDSGNDDADEELSQQSLSSRQEPSALRAHKKVIKKSNSRVLDRFFDSNSDNSEEELRKQSIPLQRGLGSGISRRTKPSFLSYSKVQAVSESSPIWRNIGEGKPSGYGAGTQPKSHSQGEMSGTLGNPRQQLSTKATASKPVPENKVAGGEKNTMPSEIEQPPRSTWQKTAASDSIAHGKTSSSADTSAVDNSMKKASHVHPKLPDYDTLAARLQSLRSNR